MTVVRDATPDDAPVMTELLVQLGYQTSAEDVPSRLAAIERDGVALVVEDESGRHRRAVATRRYSPDALF
jgi:hypothetical protein